MQNSTIYEQPLNERTRSFMRLEFLFRQVDYTLPGATVWDRRSSIASILEIHNLVSRSDLKTELLKELERHTSNLSRLGRNPDVDKKRLKIILKDLNNLSGKIYNTDKPFGYALKNNEFLGGIRQRVTVPGGTCDFDCPGYHFWLHKPDDEQLQDMKTWLSSFSLLRNAVELILGLIRESSKPKSDIATEGFYQKNLDPNHPSQLLRVYLPKDVDYFPEISSGKHRYTIRFLRLIDYEAKPKQIEDDVEFEISCCMI